MRRRPTLAATLVLLAFGSEARAQPGLEPAAVQPEPAAKPERSEYGWQILAVDGLSLATAVAIGLGPAREGFDGPPSRIGATAGTFWTLSSIAGPAVHFAHRSRMGWPSLGLRLLMPPLASAIGAFGTCMASIEQTEQSQGFENGCEDAGLIGGMLVGTAATALFDAMVLAPAARQFERPPAQRWYGWQMLAVDAVGLGFGLRSALGDPENAEGEPIEPSLALGAGMYTVSALVPPLVHGFNGHGLRLAGSYAMRLFVPPVMMLPGLIGWCAGTGGAGSGSCAKTGAGIGLAGGVAMVAVIDALVLGWEDAPAAPSEPGVAWFPRLELGRGGATVGLGGAF